MMTREAEFSRRQILCAGTSAVLTSLLPRSSRGNEPKGVPFGFTLYGMRSLPVPEALRVCHEIGYDSVELACMVDWPSAPESLSADARQLLRRQLADAQLTVASLMENVSPLGDERSQTIVLERLNRACGLGHDLRGSAPPIIETVLGGKPSEWEQVRDQMVTRLQAWGRLGEKEQTIIALKPHVSGALHTPAGAMWLMERLANPWLRLAYDYSHFELQDIPRADSLQMMLPKTAFIHVKDTAGTAAKFQFLLPGAGRTDYAAYFAQLKAAAFTGPIVVEVSGQIHAKAGYDPVAAAKSCYASLAPKLEMAGLHRTG